MNKQLESEANQNFKDILVSIWSISIQVLFNTAPFLSLFILSSVNMYYTKKLNDEQLVASLGLGISCANCLQYAPFIAMQSGLLTLLSQAMGVQNYRQMGIFFQRNLIISLIYLFISYIFLSNISIVFQYFNVNSQLSNYAQQYCRWSLFSYIFQCIIQNITTVYYAKQQFFIPMISQLIAYVTHPFWCSLFVHEFGQSLQGIAIARTFSDLLCLILLLHFTQKRREFQGMKCKSLQPEALENWIPYLKIAIPAASPVYLENISFEFQLFIITLLNNEHQLAAHTAFVSFNLLFYMFSTSMGITANSYLANSIAEGNVVLTKNLAKMFIFLQGLLLSILITFGMILKSSVILIFGTSPVMETYMSKIYNVYLIFFIIPDFYSTLFASFLRSIGLEQTAMKIYFYTYVICGIIASLIFALTFDLETLGVWYANSLVSWIGCLIFLNILYKVNLQEQAVIIQQRVNEKRASIIEIKEINQSFIQKKQSNKKSNLFNLSAIQI